MGLPPYHRVPQTPATTSATARAFLAPDATLTWTADCAFHGDRTAVRRRDATARLRTVGAAILGSVDRAVTNVPLHRATVRLTGLRGQRRARGPISIRARSRCW